MKHDLSRLGPDNFENLVTALIKQVIGAGTVTFGPGKDGAREATFSGRAPYPSAAEQWDGEWVFQAKFHDLSLLGAEKARSRVMSEISSELDRLTKKYGTKVDNYVLVTNVPLSGVHEVGNRDRIANTVTPNYPGVPNIHVWDSNDVAALLASNRQIAREYAHLLTPGDLIAELIDSHNRSLSTRAETVRMYLSESHRREGYATLEQAGDVTEEKLLLERVFIDLDCGVPHLNDAPREASHSKLLDSYLRENLQRRGSGDDAVTSMLDLLTSEVVHRLVILGGPGEGKSTIGQFLAQLHKAAILGLADSHSRNFVAPEFARLPFRVILRDFAQNLAEANADGREYALDQHMAGLVTSLSSRSFDTKDLHETLSSNPSLLLLDGLDEVTEKRVRTAVIDAIHAFLERAKALGADLMVVGTSRPNSYSDEFAPSEYLHVRLSRLSSSNVMHYVENWIQAKQLDEAKAGRLRHEMSECIRDPQLSLLTATPLQVTILVLIILGGGAPPRQKEALFADYLEIIYKREKAKSQTILLTEKQVLFGLHALVGFMLHDAAATGGAVESTMDDRQYASVVARYLQELDRFSPEEEVQARARTITQETGDRFVLIIEPRPNAHGFELRSIQEYFAAAHLCDTARTTDQRLGRFRAFSLFAHWRNVVLFMAGRIGRTNAGESPGIIEVCREIDGDRLGDVLSRGRWLALELAAERALGADRGLQNSLIHDGLELCEGRFFIDYERLASVLDRLPFEDVRDHVVPFVAKQVRTLKTEYGARYLRALAVRLPRNEGVGELALNLFRQAEGDTLTEFLSATGTSLQSKTAGDLWVRVFVKDRDKAMRILSNWSSSAGPWLIETLDHVDADSATITDLVTYGWVRPNRELIELLSPVNPRHVALALGSIVEGLVATRSDLLSALEQSFGASEKWSDLIAAITRGDDEFARSILGEFAADEVIAIFWAIHLSHGVPTVRSLRALFRESFSVRSLLSRYFRAQSRSQFAAPATAVLACAQVQAAEPDYEHLAHLMSPDGREWWERQLESLTDAMGLEDDELGWLRRYGADALPEEKAGEVVRLVSDRLGIQEEGLGAAVKELVGRRDIAYYSEVLDAGNLRAIKRLVSRRRMDGGETFERALPFLDSAQLASGKSTVLAAADLLDVLSDVDSPGAIVTSWTFPSLMLAIVSSDARDSCRTRFAPWLAAIGRWESEIIYLSHKDSVAVDDIAFLCEVLMEQDPQHDDALIGFARLFSSRIARVATVEQVITVLRRFDLSKFADSWSRVSADGSSLALKSWVEASGVTSAAQLLVPLSSARTRQEFDVWRRVIVHWHGSQSGLNSVEVIAHLLELIELDADDLRDAFLARVIQQLTVDDNVTAADLDEGLRLPGLSLSNLT